MLEETSIIDNITVNENGDIHVRRADRVLKDGIEIAKTYHRHVVSLNSDLINEDPKVVAVANAVWPLYRTVQ